MDKYPRIKHFEYFNSLAYPYVGITVNVEITDFISKIKKEKFPFFLSFNYLVIRACNSVPEFRQRIMNNKIIEFDNCYSSYTVALDNQTYCYCSVDVEKPFKDYLSYARERQELAIKNPTVEMVEDMLSYYFVSTTPYLTQTALIQPTPIPADSNPRITWGKYFKQGSKIFVPVTVLCNHALIDGFHISQFYNSLNDNIKLFCNLIKS